MLSPASAEMKNDVTQLRYCPVISVVKFGYARVHFVYQIAFTSWNASLC